MPNCSARLCLVLWIATAAPAAASTGQERAWDAGSSLIGAPAPALRLRSIDGQTIDLAALYGHTAVYLKFWATWCVPCREQMPHFERTFEQAGKDLAVIAVNAGFDDSVAEVGAYRKALGLKMPIVIDDGKLADAFHLRVTPQHVVIGRDGTIRYIGHLADQRLEDALREARLAPAVHTVAKSHPGLPDALGVGANVGGVALRGADGVDRPLRDPTGRQRTVLMFISPWCESYLADSRPERSAACRRAREQSERLAGNSAVRWIGVASGLWAAADDLAEYRSTHQIRVPMVLDEDGRWFRRFGVHDVPTLIVVEASGRVSTRIDAIGEHLDRQLGLAAD